MDRSQFLDNQAVDLFLRLAHQIQGGEAHIVKMSTPPLEAKGDVKTKEQFWFTVVYRPEAEAE